MAQSWYWLICSNGARLLKRLFCAKRCWILFLLWVGFTGLIHANQLAIENELDGYAVYNISDNTYSKFSSMNMRTATGGGYVQY